MSNFSISTFPQSDRDLHEDELSLVWSHGYTVDKCVYYNKTTNTTIITRAYEGIPENLLLNFLGWLLLLMLFAMLRKRAWNYGRIALVQKTEEKWTQLFYGTVDEVMGASEAESSSLSLDSNVHIDKGFCSWFTAIFQIKDESILQKCGPDAVQYLSFQRHIIFYTSIIMVISLSVILPINFQGQLEGDEKTFGHTTLHNLDPNSPLLWTHVTLAILYLPLGIIIMRHFSVSMQFEEKETSVSRTLMITNIPKKNCDSADLHRHFREAYPEIEVQDVQLAFDIRKVSILDRERERLYQAKLYCENYLKRTGMRLEMRPYACGNACGCCDMFGCPTVDALEYYAEEESRINTEVDSERAAALKRPLGIAFVTLVSVSAAQKVYSDHQPTCKCSHNPPSSSLSRQLEPHQWRVTFAPTPRDIFWENLSLPSKFWYLRAVLVNLFVFIVLFFLTTPAIVINMLDNLQLSHQLQNMSPVLSEFVPTLLLWMVAALLPVLVSYSDKWLSHWTRSEQNYAVMRKTFFFLLFMVLILPTLGLTSAQAFVDWTFHANKQTYRWECLFMPDKGAFFVNYVITSAFIGTGLELIRFPELFMYAWYLCLARSRAETASVRNAILWEFPFGVQYAWMLLIFAMTVIYSLPCPLITPFGLLYMILKHLVDRYNLYFAYGPSKISSRIHVTAINIVIFSISLLQLSFMMLSFLRRGFNDITIYSLIGFCITVLILSAQTFLHWCKGFSPITYKQEWRTPVSSTQGSPQRDSSIRFVPDVLQSTHSRQPDMVTVQSPVEGLSVLQRTYGTRSGTSDTLVSPDAILSFEPGPINAHDQVLLYQDYDGSNTEV
ncbi:calcium permeable stress-gated cation channel 1 isoform X2 [Anabrus simplex]|uniref:calcium permeable stress-gated cation channel 1 isoform X2 n=1 Tax=Anabrus simplex TaxID=316456 RepID=UPI0035A323BD